MAERILVDLGSSTVKAYRAVGQEAELLRAASINFKDGFSPERGLSDESQKQLLDFLAALRPSNGELNVYATALIRKLEPAAFETLQTKLAERGASLKLLSQPDEAHFLEVALAGRYDGPEPVLLINVGGGSTELVTLQNHQSVEKQELGFGVGTVIGQNDGINDSISAVELDQLVGQLRDRVQNSGAKTPIAFFSGGELTYMQVASYPLEANDVFEDVDHPSKIGLAALAARNQEVFSKVTLAQLEAMMPDNPTWMHGARAFCAITQAICEVYGVETVIPSDANLIDGIVRQRSV